MKKALILDDEEDIRDIVSEILNQLDFEVVICKDGLDGLMALEPLDYNIIITDLSMPNIGGAEFIDDLLRVKAGMSVPVLIVSAYIDDTVKEKFSSNQNVRLISKPFDIKQLKTAILEHAKP
jgi:CheY-like chemotaxis protein